MPVRVSFNPIAFVCWLKDVTSYAETTLFRHIRNKGLIKYQPSVSILLHGDPNNEFQLELEEFIFCGLIFTCYVGKYRIIVLKL